MKGGENMKTTLLVDPSTIRRQRIKIYPTESQKKFINRQISLFRFVYNWALNLEIENRKEGKPFIHKIEMNKRFAEFRNQNEWVKEIPVNTAREAIANLMVAYNKFFNKRARFPRFKSKKKSKQSFQVRNDPFAFYFRDDYVKISGLERHERILCKSHHIPKEGVRYYKPSIEFDGYNYWLSVGVSMNRSHLKYHPENSEYKGMSIGIDLGINKTAQLSDGTVYDLPDLHVLEKRRKRLKSKLDKSLHNRVVLSKRAKTKLEDIPISKNELKRKKQFFDLCRRMTNIRHSFVSNMTNDIVNKYPDRIVIEDLNVEGMIKNKIVGKLHNGSQFYLIRTQLKYKCAERDIKLVVASRSFPSSQLCSNCGHRYKIKYSRTYKCPSCGLIIDRDLNAAINLSKYEE